MTTTEIITCVVFAVVLAAVLAAEVVSHSRVVAAGPAVCGLAFGCK